MARKNLGLKTSLRTYEKKHHKLEPPRDKPERSERRKFKKDQKERRRSKYTRSGQRSKQDNSKTEGIGASEIERHKSVGERLRCAWPSDRKGSHRVKDCIRPIKLDKGTASYPKAKEYQKMKIAGIKLPSEAEESSEESDSSDSDEEESGSDSEEEDSEGEYLGKGDSVAEEEDEEEPGYWWDSPSDSD
jgi:hypothetical protein